MSSSFVMDKTRNVSQPLCVASDGHRESVPRMTSMSSSGSWENHRVTGHYSKNVISGLPLSVRKPVLVTSRRSKPQPRKLFPAEAQADPGANPQIVLAVVETVGNFGHEVLGLYGAN